MGISVQNNTCCYGFFTPYVEGKNCFVRSFGAIPAEMGSDSSAKKLAYRIKEFVLGVGLWIPLVNIIVYLALRCFENKSTPSASSGSPLGNRLSRSEASQNAQHIASISLQPLAKEKVSLSSSCESPIPISDLINFSNTSCPNSLTSNICWMNSACQMIFSSPMLVERIEREKNSSKLIGLLKGLMEAMEKGNRGAIPEIQEQIITCYRSEVVAYPIGSKHSPDLFIDKVMKDLKVSHSVETTHLTQSKVTSSSIPILNMRYKKGDSFVDTIKKRYEIVPSFQHQRLTKIPPVLVIRNVTQNASFTDVPQTADFTSFFSEAIQAKGKPILYNLRSALYTNSSKDPTSHFFRCENGKNEEHYKDSIYNVWEIADRSVIL